MRFDEILVQLGLEDKLIPLENAYNEENLNEVISKSAKLNFVMELLPTLRNEGHRVLLFTHSKLILNIIEEILIVEKYEYIWIDGDT